MMWLSRLGYISFISLLIAAMVGGIVPEVAPQTAKLAAPIVCSNNEYMTTTTKTYYLETGQTVFSNHWFCVNKGGIQRSVSGLPQLICGSYVFFPLFTLMIFFAKYVFSFPIIKDLPATNINSLDQTIGEQRPLADRLMELEQAREAKLISEDEFQKKRKSLIDSL